MIVCFHNNLSVASQFVRLLTETLGESSSAKCGRMTDRIRTAKSLRFVRLRPDQFEWRVIRCRCVSLCFRGYPCISMHVHRNPLITIDIHGCPCAWKSSHRYLWISIDLFEYPWMRMFYLDKTEHLNDWPTCLVCDVQLLGNHDGVLRRLGRQLGKLE